MVGLLVCFHRPLRPCSFFPVCSGCSNLIMSVTFSFSSLIIPSSLLIDYGAQPQLFFSYEDLLFFKLYVCVCVHVRYVQESKLGFPARAVMFLAAQQISSAPHTADGAPVLKLPLGSPFIFGFFAGGFQFFICLKNFPDCFVKDVLKYMSDNSDFSVIEAFGRSFLHLSTGLSTSWLRYGIFS